MRQQHKDKHKSSTSNTVPSSQTHISKSDFKSCLISVPAVESEGEKLILALQKEGSNLTFKELIVT